ncbi:MAG: ATP-grasp fold amidoligase family protein [Bacteroidetes bacterium]|nr:ATP-grasp fold amidoligase family protein [Bacteroidota bacterium]
MIETIKYKGNIGFYLYQFIYRLYRIIKYERLSDEDYLKKHFKKMQDYVLNLDNPKTLNEKIQWLKIHDRSDFHSLLADKYGVRDYVKKEFGEDLLIPLIHVTSNYKDINIDLFPEYPCIIKATHDSGSYLIIKDKKEINLEKLILDCRWWLKRNYYLVDREWQYKNIEPRIVIEKLLLTKEGKIPNDFKLNVINGKVEFIYVSIDREGKNKRNIYSIDWNPLHFTWAVKSKDIAHLRGEEINPPSTLAQMIEIAERIGKYFAYVRVDFYDVDGKLYFGEVTQHHGGGFDQIRPLEMDYKYGELLDLKKSS